MALTRLKNRGIADDAVTEAKWGGGQFGRRNLIINGDMRIAQRSTNSGSQTNGVQSLDRWYVNGSGGTFTSSQEEFTIGQTDVPDFPKYYMRVAFSTADNNCGVHQKVEDVTTLGGKTVTLSFWAKGTNPGGGSFVSSWIQNFGTGGSGTVETLAESSIVLTSSWQKFTITFDVPSISGKTIGGTNNYTWVEVLRQPSTDTSTTAWTADIANVQLEVGSVATPFEHRSYAEELSLCHRYYYRINCTTNYQSFGAGVQSSNYEVMASIVMPVEMRAEPSISYSALTDLNYSGVYFGGSGTLTAIGYGYANTRYLTVAFTGPNSNTVGDAKVARFGEADGSGWIAFNAEL